MNEKLSLPPATTIEQLQQQQQQKQKQQPTHAFATIDHADYHYESTLPATTTITTTIYNHEHSNSNNSKTSGIDGKCAENDGGRLGEAGGFGDEGGGGGGVGGSNELYRYASVASLGGGGGGGGGCVGLSGGVTMLPMDAFMANAASGHSAPTPHSQATTILKINSNGSGRSSSKGSNVNSPHKQQLGATQRDNFCGWFGCFRCCGRGRGGGGVSAQTDAGGGGCDDKQQQKQQHLSALTFWPALFANLGICTLLLGYLFIGSFLFLTIETSGDGGSAAGVVSDPKAWSHAQNAYISTQQQQQQTQQHTHKPQPSFSSEQPSKLYKSSEPLLDATSEGGGGVHQVQGAPTTDGVKLKPHESSSSMSSNGDFHVNTPNTEWQTMTEVGILKNNSTGGRGGGVVAGGAAAAVKLAKPFGQLSKPETETYMDNKHTSKLRPTNSITNSQHAMEAEAYRKAAAAAAIGNDINGADIDVDTAMSVGIGMGVGMDEEDDGYGNAAAFVGGAWGGENVALQRTVENIWDITVSLNILYKENWTKLAALEINKFQDQLVKRLVMDLTLSTTVTGSAGEAAAHTTTMNNNAHLRQQQQQQYLAQQPPSKSYDYHSMKSATNKHYGNDAIGQQQQRERYWQLQAARQRQWQLQKQKQQFEWNFATSFLYSLTVVTTVGYGTITPRTTLGRMLTIVYATFGIPLTLVYLASIGSILAKLTSGFCERLLCCCFCRSSTTKRHTICGFSRQQVSDKKCNLKLQQLQKQHQQQQQHTSAGTVQSAQQQQQQQQQQHTTQPTQSAHLPYCYVRPPADDALSYGEHSPPPPQLSTHSGSRSASGVNTLRWSLALPIGFCVLLLLAYVAFGSLVIALLEQWSLFDGIYFCFMSLTTIGFCDLLPGVHVGASSSTTSATSTLVVWFCAAYILSGLTLTSMCVNMLHDEFLQRMRVVVKFKKIASGKNAAKERSFYGAPP